MNRKNLTAAVLAGLAGAAGIASTAQAVNLNPDGLGQVLIYPYYTANAGNETILSVVNTTGQGKAVKVRFLEGMNSKEVLDFNLYMSAYDVWAAAIIDQDGKPAVTTSDTSCTVPGIETQDDQTQEFFNLAYAGDGSKAYPGDKGPTGLDRAYEGHFELIEMGTICTVDDEADASVQCDDETIEGAVEYYTTHVIDPDGEEGDAYELIGDEDTVFEYGRPRGCAVHNALWTVAGGSSPKPGIWVGGDTGFGLRAPTGGLFGGAAVVNGAKGSLFSYDARAIEGFSVEVIHFEPGFEQPSLADGVAEMDIHTAYVYDGAIKDVRKLTYNSSVDAVSAVFMHDTMMNEYNTETLAGAASEWVVTFPTKSFYTNGSEPEDPFQNVWSDNDAYPFGGTNDGVYDGACEIVKLGPGENGIWNREENTFNPEDPNFDPEEPVFSPSNPTDPTQPPAPTSWLCYETNVIRFGELPEGETGATYAGPTEIFGSERVRITTIDNASLGFESGWVQVDLTDAEDPNKVSTQGAERFLESTNGYYLMGLPMTGFWAAEFQNNFAPTNQEGVLATQHYGGLFSHKATRLVSAVID